MCEYRPARQVIRVFYVVRVASSECGCVTVWELFKGGANSKAGRNQGNTGYKSLIVCKLQRTGRRLDPVNAVLYMPRADKGPDRRNDLNTITCVCPSAEVQSVHEVKGLYRCCSG